MLNKNSERELAYLVKIDDIQPIPGKDRVESATVGGWTIMVRKDQFKPGDIGIYFEIDSKCPEKEPFMFLEQKHFKIKTQKYKTETGHFWSQGLLMHPSDFGWETIKNSHYHTNNSNDETEVPGVVDDNNNIHSLDDESRFLTKELGVTYYDPEDNARKSNPNSSKDKYSYMVAKHKKFFKSKIGQFVLRHKFTKNIAYFFFGGKKKKKNWPEWVKKTDEERCLPGGTKVLTENGWVQISKLVNRKIDTKVASMNSDGTISFEKILDYQKFENNTDMVTIKYPYRCGVSRTNGICCTTDHKILTDNGYVEACNIKVGDFVYTPTEAYEYECIPAVYGMLLGDSHISRDRRANGMLKVVATNGEKQLEYLNYKKSIFNCGKITKSGIGSFSKTPCYHWTMCSDSFISESVRKDWYKNGKKEVSDGVIDKLTAVSLAFWYMDDGCVTYRNDARTAYFIRLNTQGFSLEENEMLSKILMNRFGIRSKVNLDKIAKDGHQLYRIDISSTEEADKFFNLISPYICDCMLYKLPDKWHNREFIKLSYKKTNRVLPIPVISVENGKTKNKVWSKKFKYVYDIEVEGNHNFIADNIVVHNCQNMPWILKEDCHWIATEKIDGTSTTFTMRRKGRKYEFYVCSRNVVFDKPDKACFYDTNVYLEMAEKYKVEKVLKHILETNKKLEWVTLQGETYGGNIQKRNYSTDKHDFAGFNLIDSVKGRWNSLEARNEMEHYGIPWVPIVDQDFKMPETVEELLEIATDTSVIDGKEREGLVFRDWEGVRSFKAVSNEFLVKYHNS